MCASYSVTKEVYISSYVSNIVNLNNSFVRQLDLINTSSVKSTSTKARLCKIRWKNALVSLLNLSETLCKVFCLIGTWEYITFSVYSTNIINCGLMTAVVILVQLIFCERIPNNFFEWLHLSTAIGAPEKVTFASASFH